MKHERLILLHIDLFYLFFVVFYFSFYLFIYLFIISVCIVDLDRFLSLQKVTFGRSARLKFKLLIDKHKLKVKIQANYFLMIKAQLQATKSLKNEVMSNKCHNWMLK